MVASRARSYVRSRPRVRRPDALPSPRPAPAKPPKRHIKVEPFGWSRQRAKHDLSAVLELGAGEAVIFEFAVADDMLAFRQAIHSHVYYYKETGRWITRSDGHWLTVTCCF